MSFKAQGLTAAEAARRLAAEGPNALPAAAGHGLLALTLHVLREPMFLLLIAACTVYLLLGDLHEALVLAASIVLVIAITVVQQRRTERAIDALRDLSSPRALVIRDGREQRIAGVEVVRGDTLLLREGDRVPADVRLVEVHGLHVDESLLTGESVPVAKRGGVGAERDTHAYSGTLVVRGTAAGEAVATGARSELGRIGGMLAQAEPARTSLEAQTGRLVRRFAIFATAFCTLVAIAYGLLRGDWLAGVLSGLTLAMALLPEEFPVVLTVFLALGAWRIAAHGVLTRRMAAVELLGAATVLCCDKTGTLTENAMAVVETWHDGAWHARGEGGAAERLLLQAGARASEPRPFDPMERAFHEASPGAHGEDVLERRYPLSESLLAVTHGWRRKDGQRIADMKGAPEVVLGLCDLPPEARMAAERAAAEAAVRGLRLLGVARAQWEGDRWPDTPQGMPFRFIGFAALADPVREAVPAAIAACRRAGIRVVMITGDHPGTARAIAMQAGIEATQVVTGPELNAMDDARLGDAVRRCQVFARVRPEQKLRLVKALKAAGEVVAMTGDGVNDAPALKAADIGVAMGRRGTDVAREAAALVLLEDDFTALVGTVQLGRRIYENIRNAMRYLFAVHVPLAGMAFIPLVAGWPFFFFPVHVVFLQFVIDPACSIAFEAERSDAAIMDRPPRAAGERLFTAASVGLGVALGLGLLAVVALVFGAAIVDGRVEGEARALAFATLVAGNLGLIFVNRSTRLAMPQMLRRQNPALWWIVGGAAVSLAAVLSVPALQDVFRFAPTRPLEALAAAVAGFASVLWIEPFKRLRKL